VWGYPALGAAVVACGACGFSPHAAGGDAATVTADSDGATVTADAFPDAPPGEVCFGTLAYDRICYLAANVPSGTKTYQVITDVDTDDGPTCNGNMNLAATVPGNPCIVAAGDIEIVLGAELDVHGSHPLILLATAPQGIDLDGSSVIDAGANAVGGGPGSPDHCSGTTAAAQKSGGFGGSFLAVGGKGGLGSGDTITSKGLPAPVLAVPMMLEGGCPGGIGANNDNVTPAAGGGAIALIAMKLTIDGIVAVGGAGGETPNQDQAGGNGGGAGGMIVLDAPAINGMGELDAKGGGGGEGKGGNQSTSGSPGYNPINRAEDGLGGATANSSGGDGGHGGPVIAATTNTGGDGHDGTSAGGGGGGGAAGLVLVKSALPVLLVSSPVAIVAP
jgi:hypothetical protein